MGIRDLLSVVWDRHPKPSERDATARRPLPPVTKTLTDRSAEVRAVEAEMRQAQTVHASSSRLVQRRARQQETGAIKVRDLLEGLLDLEVQGHRNDR
jgi:hypothetical protein